MPITPDISASQSGIYFGNVPTEPVTVDQSKPELLDTLAAAARQTNVAGSLYARFENQNPSMPNDPEFKPEDHLDGFENETPNVLAQLVSARTRSELEGIKNRVREQRADEDTLRRSGATGFFAGLGFGIADPSFLAAAFVPEVSIASKVRAARVLTEIARGTAGAALYEGELQPLQETRTATQGLTNIAAGSLLSAALGSMSRTIPKEELSNIERQIVEPRSTVGAAATQAPGTLADESLVAGGLSNTISKVPLIATDADIIMNSELASARSALQELADIPGMTRENLAGVSSGPSVEINVRAQDAQAANLSDEFESSYAKYARETPKEQRLTREDYGMMLSDASRNGDIAPIKQGQKFVQMMRQFFNEPYEYAIKNGLAEAVDRVVGSPTYFMRMYNQDLIRNNLDEWKTILESHFEKSGADRGEILAAVNDVTSKILHNDIGQSNFGTKITVANAGPLKERVLDIPDAAIKKFLVNDPIKVARAYAREMHPRVELHKRFGDVDMKQQFQNIADEAAAKEAQIRALDIPAAEKNKRLKSLSDSTKQSMEALERVKRRVLGTAAPLPQNDNVRKAILAVRGFRQFVAATKLGGVALTGGVMDTARTVAQYGFMPTIKTLTKLATSPEFKALSAGQARRVGAAVEVAMARRLNIALEGGVTEGWTRKLADGMYKYTGLSHVTDFNRMLSATLFEDWLVKASQKINSGGTLKKYEVGKLASLGIGADDMKAIAAQVDKYGGDAGGAQVSGSAMWDNPRLAQIYDRAILKESLTIVQQPGAADRVWWMDSEIGKTLGQIRAFSLSSLQRLTLPGLQMAAVGGPDGWARFARFAGYMMIGGYLTHAIRSVVAGREPVTNPTAAAANALSESGLMGILPDMIDPPGRLLSLTDTGKNLHLGEFFGTSKYADRSLTAAYGGPAIGAANDMTGALFNAASGQLSQSDIHGIRRNFVPWQNVWFLRRPINALEGEVGEALGVKGSDTATFGERLMRTEAVKQ